MNAFKDISNIRLSLRQKLKYVFATRIGGVVGGFAVINSLILFFSAMVYGTSIYQVQLVEALASMVTPAVESALDASSDMAALAENELTKFSELYFVSYAALADDSDKTIATWRRNSEDDFFHHSYASHIASGDFGFTRHGVYSRFDIKEYHLVIGTSLAETAWINLTRYWLFYTIITIIVIISISTVFFLFDAKILTPLTGITAAATRIITENDLTLTIPDEYRSEIGQVAKCINLVIAKLRNILLGLRDTCQVFEALISSLQNTGSDILTNADAIRQSIGKALELTGELNSSFGDVSLKMQELNNQSESGSATVYEMEQVYREVSANIAAMSTSVQDSIYATEQMTNTIQNTAGYVSLLNDGVSSVNSSMQRLDASIAEEGKWAVAAQELAEELAINAENGQKSLKETIRGIGKIKKSSKETTRVISALGDHAMNIGKILRVIDDVTKQTNLLALNAAIISAQAGKNGRGFAVVAEEINALANRTKNSTKEISGLIKTIQLEAKRAVAMMEESNQTIERGAKLGVEASHAFDKFKESADKSTDRAAALLAASTEQDADVQEVNAALLAITGTVEELDSFAQQQAKDASDMNAAASEMNILNLQVAKSSQEQTSSAQKVLEAIENISAMSTMVNERQTAQIKSTEEAGEAVDFVNKNALAQGEAAGKLVAIIEAIDKQLKQLAAFTAEFKI